MFSPFIKFYQLGFNDDYKLTDNFSIRELYEATKLVDSEYLTLESIPLHRNALSVAQYLRDELQIPLFIGSAYRSSLYEATKGRSQTGSHPMAEAIDLNSSPNNKILTDFVLNAFNSKNHIYQHLKSLGVNSYGFYDWGVHLDFRERKADNTDRFWDDRTKKKIEIITLIWVIPFLIVLYLNRYRIRFVKKIFKKLRK